MVAVLEAAMAPQGLALFVRHKTIMDICQMTEPKPLTVGELIAALNVFPHDKRVVVTGSEYGLDDAVSVRETAIVWDTSPADYEGRHAEEDNGFWTGKERTATETAIFIVSNRRNS